MSRLPLSRERSDVNREGSDGQHENCENENPEHDTAGTSSSTTTATISRRIRLVRRAPPATQSSSSSSSSSSRTKLEGPQHRTLHSCMDAIKLIPENLLYESDEEERKTERVMGALFEPADGQKQQPSSFTVDRDIDLARPPLLTIYRDAPEPVTTHVDVLMEIAQYRLEILQCLYQPNQLALSLTERRDLCSNVEARLLESGFHTLSRYLAERHIVVMRDRLAHFILRLAFADDPVAQAWFIDQECRLLQVKLWCVEAEFGTPGLEEKWVLALESVMRPCGVCYEILKRNPVSSDYAQRQLWDEIRISLACAGVISKQKNRSPPETVIKIAFCPDGAPVCRQRKCFLKDGYCYVALHEMEITILHHFRQILLDSFTMLKSKSIVVKDDILSNPVFGPILRWLAVHYTGVPVGTKTDDQSAEAITTHNIDKLSARSFPPCMKLLVSKLKEKRHLRHWGRLQLWLFLKGCKMTMDDQLYWWRSIWHDPEKFDKELRYNIRHAYGQEGKQSNYGAWSCSKIIMGNPAPAVGEFHGCPFRHFDTDPLKRFLQANYRIPLGTMNTITLLKDSHQYQLSCQQLFKLAHPASEGDGVGNQPNAYYTESCRYHRAQESGPKESGPKESSAASTMNDKGKAT